ncbi:NAD(P)H-dependent oxidoreductase subunit E [Lutibacter sp.]|uniref:NAD(P)H-dependent oxidoreductase subunit E n=1 Tax=Lutibacter sp. TaxID=1925666 RepID=UPI00273707D9|nr:NAD(P)H-dependent oxidoreductase subunit E [Lutibacter sp.]MDP3312811.1 NAD(P)H-dependent oxidoreductase subunit E [Lutibacter sp.]
MQRTDLLNRLWEFQNKFGFISDIAVAEIAQELKVSKIEIEGVISFYHFFHRQPTGKYIIYLNNSIVSEFKGFQEVKAAFEFETGCTFGKYGQSQLFSLFETSCIGLSDQECTALINFYPVTHLSTDKVRTIVNQLKIGISPNIIANNVASLVQHIPPQNKSVFFKNYSIGNSLKNLKNKSPQFILDELKKVELAGKGGAFFPTAQKWEISKNATNAEKVVICNADEGEPGTFKDKTIIENLPGLIIEGMILAAYVTGATTGFIYLRAEYKYLQSKLENAIIDFYQHNLLGVNCCEIKHFNFDLQLQIGAGAYVCGAETALIESLEGYRGEPRLRVQYPTENGYLGSSTIVNNVETFAKASRIIEFGSDYILSIGTEKSKGTKIICISGDVAKPGIYEIEWGTTLRELLRLSQATAPYFIQSSGPSGDCLNESDFDRKICKEDLLCGGSLMIFNRTRSILQILENYIKFFLDESCGSCTSCRVGNQILLAKIEKLKKGICTTQDLNEIIEWGTIMKKTSRCGLGQFSSNTFIQSISKFENYFNVIVTSCTDNCNVEFDMENAVFDYDQLIKKT